MQPRRKFFDKKSGDGKSRHAVRLSVIFGRIQSKEELVTVWLRRDIVKIETLW
jgi:hypothetical protein